MKTLEEQVIYENPNGRNKILEGEDCYILRGSKEEDAVFDKDPNALAAVIAGIEMYGPVSSESKYGCYRFRPAAGKCIRLSSVIYKAYHGIDPYNTQRLHLHHEDQNILNLRKDNLILLGEGRGVLSSDVHDQFAVCRTLTNKFAVVNNNPQLIEILTCFPLYYCKRGKCFKVVINKKRYSIYHLVWVYYNYPNITSENIGDHLARMRRMLIDKKLSIDHKHSSAIARWDNRIENLQLIPSRLNAAKSNITTEFPPGCFYIPTVAGEIYGRYTDGHIDYCENIGAPTFATIEQLRRFGAAGEFGVTDNHSCVPLDSPLATEILQAAHQESFLYPPDFIGNIHTSCNGRFHG